jgi:hypothetical protein
MARTLDALEQELRAWSGVTYEVADTRPHPKLYVQYSEQRRFLPFSSTSVEGRGMRNKVSQLRRLLHELGAQRNDR